MTAAALLAAAGFALGYAAHAIRPCRRATRWADRVCRTAGPDHRRKPTWWLAQAVYAVAIAAAFAMDPAHVIRLWRHRNDPPPPRSPALHVNTPPSAPAPGEPAA